MFEEEILKYEFEELFNFLKFNYNNNVKVSIDIEQLLKFANSFKEKIKRNIKNYEKEYLLHIQK
jgi:hypothetical protein